ncbi:unnamed protein product [[Candida] boidinii]|uniref:ER membrane protein complex subunit 3 n=1 Tax=Candida boidinii TaxID=5477 RepID=A0A9W6WFS7_CANBO|nr:unnamed protein product [[Candida] boidinii]GMG05133.1 unnamed protein product [[Candida] boidinii]
MNPELLLDPSLRYWVLIPISLVMVMVGVLRSYITILLQPSPKIQDWKVLREQSKEILKDDPEKPKEPANPFTDPNTTDAMFQMLKGNIANYIPQTVIMWWVNFFFSGFVIMKLPFPLTLRFKSMLQAGVSTPDLDVRWVSSISWYFVNLLGLKSIYNLILQDSDIVNQLMQQTQQQSPQMSMPGAGAPATEKIFKAEAENIQILSFESSLDGIEERFIKKFNNQLVN